jgi:hypothetical protein
MPKTVKPVRCAIYTRKSTEEGLDQEFSSLDAQCALVKWWSVPPFSLKFDAMFTFSLGHLATHRFPLGRAGQSSNTAARLTFETLLDFLDFVDHFVVGLLHVNPVIGWTVQH